MVVCRGISASEVSVARTANIALLRASLASKCARVTSANSDVSPVSCEALWFDCSLPGVLALQCCSISSICFAECDLAIDLWNGIMGPVWFLWWPRNWFFPVDDSQSHERGYSTHHRLRIGISCGEAVMMWVQLAPKRNRNSNNFEIEVPKIKLQ